MFATIDKRGINTPLCSEDIYKVVMANKDRIDAAVKPERDMNFDFFGFKTLEKSEKGCSIDPGWGGRGGQRQAGSQTLEGLFLPVSTPIFASKYSFESS